MGQSSEPTQALIDSGSEVNVVGLAYAKEGSWCSEGRREHATHVWDGVYRLLCDQQLGSRCSEGRWEHATHVRDGAHRLLCD